MKTDKITPPDGYTFKYISETEVQLVPIKSKYPMSIKDIERQYAISKSNHYGVFILESKDNTFSSESTAKKFAAMIQLKELCDARNKIDGFVPKFDGEQENMCIQNFNGTLCVGFYDEHTKPLAFKDEGAAELFLNTFRPLIEQAGDLI